jgi:hypothetical protein
MDLLQSYYQDTFVVKNFDPNVEFYNHKFHLNIESHDPHFDVYVSQSGIDKKFSISDTIFLPDGFQRQIYWGFVDGRYVISPTTFQLLSTGNPSVIRSFLWELKITNIPTNVSCFHDKIRIHYSNLKYSEMTDPVGICHKRLIDDKNSTIKNLMNDSNIKKSAKDKKYLKNKLKDTNVLGAVYILVLGNRHPLNHVDKEYFEGASVCNNLHKFKNFAKNGLNSIIHLLNENRVTLDFLNLISVPIKKEDFAVAGIYNFQRVRDMVRPSVLTAMKETDLEITDQNVSDLCNLYISIKAKLLEHNPVSQKTLSEVKLANYYRMKFDAEKIKKYAAVLKAEKKAKRVKKVKPVLKIPEIVITTHFTVEETIFTQRRFKDNYKFRLHLITKNERLIFWCKIIKHIYKKWLKSLKNGLSRYHKCYKPRNLKIYYFVWPISFLNSRKLYRPRSKWSLVILLLRRRAEAGTPYRRDKELILS